MLKLYNKEHEAISAILNIKDYKIEYLLSGEDSLEFSLSISDENINLLQEECYIRNELNEYVVKEIDPSNDFKRFNCILNLEDIKAKSIFNFETENNNIDDTIRLAIAGTGWVLVDSNITKRRTVRLKNTNALEVLREISKVFKIDYRFDSINKKIYVYEQYGSDKGVYFSDELNLTDLKFPSDTYEYITRIIPIGKDGLKISSVNGGKEYIDNFQYTNKVIEYIWEDNRYTDAQSLKDDAIAKLNELSKPKKVYEANVYDLAKYSDEYNFLEFFLGDTITILSKKDNFKDKQRIVKYIQYPKEPYKNTCELGNTTLTFEELQQENEYKNQVLNNITTDNNTLDGSKVDEISTNQIRDFDVEVGRVVNLEAVNAKINNLVATDVNITGQLNAVKADIGTLNANVANIDELVVKHTATINELNANKANISDLNATNATIDILESRVANIDHILAGNITADNIQAGTITAGSGIIADGAIGNAQISSINAGKIEAGTIDTSKITVAGPNSNLKISGNRLQVFTGIGSNQFERVSLGDVNGDGSIYGFRVRGADGQTILIDENGVKKEGITDGSITNEKISNNANIDGSKLDINSVVRNINKDGTEVIKGTKINVSGTNLETKLSTITQKQTEDSERITQAYSKITANENKINLKVDNQTYQTDKNNINTTLNKNTSEISLLKDKIALKVEQTDITNAINNIQVGGRNLLITSNMSHSPKLINSSSVDNGLNIELYTNNNSFKLISETTSIENYYRFMNPSHNNLYGLEVGEYYTISGYVRGNQLTGRFVYRSQSSNGSSWNYNNHVEDLKIESEDTFNFFKFSTKVPVGATGHYISFQYYEPVVGGWIELKNIKLEKGNKATDWTPSPEDITSEILAVDSKATTINNKVSEITANLNSITQRVSSTETNTTTLTNKLNELQIGGRNLILNSGNFSNNKPHGWTVVNENYMEIIVDGNYLKLTEKSPENTGYHIYTPTTISEFQGEYIFTMKARVSSGTLSISPFLHNPSSGGVGQFSNMTLNNEFNIVTSTIKYSNLVTNIQTLRFTTTNMTAGQSIYIEWMKLEKGNKATDWSPAPEDIDKEVTEVKEKVSDIVLDVNTITSTVKNNYYTKGDVDSKGYQTESQVQQTVNQLQIKFTESGGYNLLRNGGAKNGITFWKSITSNNFKTISDTTSQNTTSSGTVFAVGCNTTTEKTAASYRFLVKPNTKYTISFSYYIGYNSTGLDVWWLESDAIAEKDNLNNTSYTTARNLLAESSFLSGKYRKRTITITTSTNAKSCYIRLDNNGTKDNNTSYTYFTDIMVSEGELALPWSPHPSEIYDGITTIDKDGITVTSSNVKSKTSMTASGFKITKTDTNEDVFKVNSDGTLNMTRSITTKTSGARSILTGDGINFYNGDTHAGKVSYDTLGAGTVEEARERLWLRSLSGYALKIQSSGDMSLEANGTSNTIFMKGNSLKVTAPTYIYGNLFLNNNNIYAANNVEIKGTLSASSNINVSGKIKAMGNIEINKGTIYLPAGGGNNTAEFIRLANCFMAAVTNSMHFVDINGNKSYLYAASVNTYSLLNNNQILTRSNETALSLMENISVINTSNGYQLKPKYKERTIGESSTGITLKYDEKNKCEAVEVNINKVINILWKAILELKQEYDSFKNTIIEN